MNLRPLFFLLLSPVFVWSQSGPHRVSGTVSLTTGKGLKKTLVLVRGKVVDTTERDGSFSFRLDKGRYMVTFSNDRYQPVDTLLEVKGDLVLDIVIDPANLAGVDVTTDPMPPMRPIDAPEYIGPSMDFLRDFKNIGLGINSNNELTANYNVRGGNYDENGIYVNGFEIYRPLLMRSGQQEGLSFIHSLLVDQIAFSAGGFSSIYNDKLSSILDVRYRKPKEFKASAIAGLMGAQAHVESNLMGRVGYILGGVRYRANGYLLNALPTTGDYDPKFFDAQTVMGFILSDELHLELLGHYSHNTYAFIPSDRETSFGTINQAYQLKMYFEGQEQTQFHTGTVGASLAYRAAKNLRFKFYTSAFISNEYEQMDVLTQYWINLLETDPAKEEAGDSIATIGVGSSIEHARNSLLSRIYNGYFDGAWLAPTDLKRWSSELKWGARYQYEEFTNTLSEWVMIDSAGYSIPQAPADEIVLDEVIRGDHFVVNNSYTGFVENTFRWFPSKDKRIKYKVLDDSTRSYGKKDTLRENVKSTWELQLGARAGYRTLNGDSWFTPRARISWVPRVYVYQDGVLKRRLAKFYLAGGLYHQPPLYREMLDAYGSIHPDVLAQKSAHVILGGEYFFEMWKRKSPFLFRGEVYYKHLWDLNPYEYDNVRVRYTGENNAKGYAVGADFQVSGEFVNGLQSFLRVGFLKTQEDIFDDRKVYYLNQSGDTISPGYTYDDSVASTIVSYPGYIPRPTDQLFTLAVMFQDEMPRFEQLKAQLSLYYGTRLPYGPPKSERFEDTLRMKSYFRVDLGMIWDLLNKPVDQRKPFWRHFSYVRVSAQVFNLLGVNNVISYNWVKDVNGAQYAVPNHLTGRRFNVRLSVGLDPLPRKKPKEI